MSWTPLVLALLATALVGASLVAAEDVPAPPPEPPRLDAETALSGRGFVVGLPSWEWRPGHPELVRWVGGKDADGGRERRLVRRRAGQGEIDLVPAGALARCVPPEPRLPVHGIGRRGAPSHVFTEDGGQLLVVERGHLAWFDLREGRAPDGPPRGRCLQRPAGPIADLKPAPDGSAVAFSHDYDLWLVPTDGGPPRQRTQGGTEAVRHATLDWVYPEELGHDTAIWWSPDAKRIAFLAMDERDVPTFEVPRFGGRYPRPETMRYPKAGDPNPRVRVGVVTAAGDDSPVWLDLGTPAPEYVVGVTWVPDSQRLLVVTLDRNQQRLQLHLVHAETGTVQAVLEETAPGWINPPRAPEFVDGERFLQQSVATYEPTWWLRRVTADGIDEGEQLTGPDMQVVGPVRYDARTGRAALVRREGLMRRPWLREGPDQPWRPLPVGDEGDDVAASFSDDLSHVVLTRSTPRTPPVKLLRKIGSAAADETLGRAARPALGQLELAAYEEGEAPLPDDAGSLLRPDGTPARIRWRLWRPPTIDEGAKLPVILDVYGGPGSIAVDGDWGRQALWATYLASRGFLYLQVDGRGSGGQGTAFEQAVRGGLGLSEIDDQARAVRDVAARFPFVDGSRVGVFGWSFGGTMALLALTRRPDVFRCGVAVAPVTDWRLYDTIYTERFMGTPKDNPIGYEATSLLETIGQLRGPVLVVHGLADDNVHAQNTLQLVERSIQAGCTTLETMLYPDVGHGLGGAKADMVRRQLAFFERHLK
ncbi:MAG: DPP IV N-terminal domain-containing protein [Planctomycetota bacterium]